MIRYQGSKGDSYDNALAEIINGLYRQKHSIAVGSEMGFWFNNQRLLELIGYDPPAGYEACYCQQ